MPPPEHPETGSDPVILLVGFEDGRGAFARWPERFGWLPVVCSRVEEALAWLKQGRPDAMVFLAPSVVGRGISALRRLSGQEPAVRRVVCLPNPDATAAVRYLNEGGADYLLTGAPQPRRIAQAVRGVLTREGQPPALTGDLDALRTRMESKLRERNLELSRANRELRKALRNIEQKNNALTLLNESLKVQSTTDPLTGLFNRREFLAQIRHEWDRSHRYQRPLSLIMLDIDHFKQINDTHGHECGDRVLQTLGELIRRNKRAQDTCCRYGGEEFLVLLPETTLISAFQVAEGLRRRVDHHAFRYRGQRISVQVSMGVSGLREHRPEKVDAFINHADEAMYRAKREGRNRTVMLNPEQPGEILQQAGGGGGD